MTSAGDKKHTLEGIYHEMWMAERKAFRSHPSNIDICFNVLYIALGYCHDFKDEIESARETIHRPLQDLKFLSESDIKKAANALALSLGYSYPALVREAADEAVMVMDSISRHHLSVSRPQVLMDEVIDTLVLFGASAHFDGYVYVQMNARHQAKNRWTKLRRVFIGLLDRHYEPIPAASLAIQEPTVQMVSMINEVLLFTGRTVHVSAEKVSRASGTHNTESKTLNEVGNHFRPSRHNNPCENSTPSNGLVAKRKGENKNSASSAQPTNGERITIKRTIKVGDFIVRKHYGTHHANGHSLESIQGEVAILPNYGGEPELRTFNAFWCPKCDKYFILDDEYRRLKAAGLICCRIIEEKDLEALNNRGNGGEFGSLAPESVAHMYGCTVSKQSGLSRERRQLILSFLIENRIQTTQELANLLELLIDMRKKNPSMRDAVSCWREDLRFLRNYQRPKRTVRVDRLYVKGDRLIWPRKFRHA